MFPESHAALSISQLTVLYLYMCVVFQLDELVGKVRVGLSKCSQSLTQLSALVN